MTRRTLRLLPAAACLAAAAQLPAEAEARAAVTDSYTRTATVQTVDPVTREVLLRDDRSGEVFVFTADEDLRNFDRIEPADTVVATLVRGVATALATPGMASPTATMATARAAEGEMPGGMAGASITAVATLLSYDADAHVATVRDDAGVVRELTLRRPELRDFARTLSPGDRVEVTFSEAVIVTVEK